MGLFDIFNKENNAKSLEKETKETNKDYHSMNLTEKVDYVYNTLVRMFPETGENLLYVLSKLLVYFVIDCEGITFSNLEDALSINNNPLLKTIDNNDYVESKLLIESLHNSDYELKSIDDLTRYEDNKDLYALERAIISVFFDGRELPDIYRG